MHPGCYFLFPHMNTANIPAHLRGGPVGGLVRTAVYGTCFAWFHRPPAPVQARHNRQDLPKRLQQEVGVKTGIFGQAGWLKGLGLAALGMAAVLAYGGSLIWVGRGGGNLAAYSDAIACCRFC